MPKGVRLHGELSDPRIYTPYRVVNYGVVETGSMTMALALAIAEDGDAEKYRCVKRMCGFAVSRKKGWRRGEDRVEKLINTKGINIRVREEISGTSLQ